jgi:dienelactone hydrolase
MPKTILFACVAFFLLLLPAASVAEPEQNKVEKYFPSLSYAQLSPDGKHMVGIAESRVAREFLSGLAKYNIAIGTSLFMIDTDTLEFKGMQGGAKWLNEGNWKYLHSARRVRWVTNELLSVEYGPLAELVNMRGEVVLHLGQSVIGKAEPDNPDSPYMIVAKGDDNKQLFYANIKTGEMVRIRYPMSGKPLSTVFDAKGNLRALTLLNSEFWNDATTLSNWYRPNTETPWEKLAEFKVSERVWTPESISDDDNSLVVSSAIGRDTNAVFLYDVKKRAMTEMMAGHPTEDIRYVEGMNLSKFTAVVTDGMKPKTVWFDRAWSKAQRSADEALPGRINVLTGNPAKRLLIFSYSDVDPGTWYLLDMEMLIMKKFAMVSPNLDAKKMRPMEVTSYAARDGLKIPAYLTRPEKVVGPAPMVVLIHGGPTARDHWGWDRDAQVLAGHGFVVFQPQFRGSTGFGAKFVEAGFGQWGLAMQDDITDGVEALIQRGIADPKRICIFGASYGGYAAYWGLVKTPKLYRCGVSFAGVSDIEHMFSDRSDRNANKVSREILRARVGGMAVSKEQFAQVSPLKHAELIQVPLLVMHGNKDQRVPISHSKNMMQALDRHKKTYEWHEFDNEGHGLSDAASDRIFYEKLLAFLDKYIAPDKKPTEPELVKTEGAKSR